MVAADLVQYDSGNRLDKIHDVIAIECGSGTMDMHPRHQIGFKYCGSLICEV